MSTDTNSAEVLARRNTARVRHHPADLPGYTPGAREFESITEPCAVVIRPDGSVDVYGYIGVVDQRQGPPRADRIAAALAFARTYGQIPGDHHRAWVIEHMTAALEGRPADESRGIAP